MKPLPPEKGKISQAHTSGVFLEKPGLLKEALRRSEEWNQVIPGSYGQKFETSRVTTLEKSLLKLKEDQEAEARYRDRMIVDPNDDGRLTLTSASNGDPAAPMEEEIDSEFEDFDNKTPEAEITLNIQKLDEESPGIVKQGDSKDPVVVFIRHGRTPHNQLGLFTGWEDPPLVSRDEGV